MLSTCTQFNAKPVRHDRDLVFDKQSLNVTIGFLRVKESDPILVIRFKVIHHQAISRTDDDVVRLTQTEPNLRLYVVRLIQQIPIAVIIVRTVIVGLQRDFGLSREPVRIFPQKMKHRVDSVVLNQLVVGWLKLMRKEIVTGLHLVPTSMQTERIRRGRIPVVTKTGHHTLPVMRNAHSRIMIIIPLLTIPDFDPCCCVTVLPNLTPIARRGIKPLKRTTGHAGHYALLILGVLRDDIDDAVDRIGAPHRPAGATHDFNTFNILEDKVVHIPEHTGKHGGVNRATIHHD